MKALRTSGHRAQDTLRQSLVIVICLALTGIASLAAQTADVINQQPQAVQTVFTNPAQILIADAPPNNTPGVGSIYPSPITVSGMPASITNITVTLKNVNHLFPGDLDVLLVGPGGQSLILQSDAGGITSAVNRTYTFDGAAATQLAATGGLPNNISVRPANHQGNDTTNDLFPAPAPAGPYGNPGPQSNGPETLNGVFGGTNPNGVWQLYVTDDEHIDDGRIGSGWSLNITAQTPVTYPLSRVSDYDGDNQTDLAVVRPNGNMTAAWYINGSTAGFIAQGWGIFGTDSFVPHDYDGDGKTDIAVWRGTEGNWYILQSQTSTLRAVNFGSPGDNPTAVDDYDGDGKADPAVVRNSGGSKVWYFLGSTSGFGYKQWGLSTDTIAPGDYDGDGKADFAVRRGNDPSAGLTSFYIDQSTSGFQAFSWGNNADIVAPGDYDGDNKTDIAVGHLTGSDIFWYVRLSGGGFIENVRWGVNGDIAVQGDYNGDNKTDIAVWRAGTASFYVLYTGVGGNLFAQWGATGDYPAANSNAH
jgi:hypothetical protein